MTEIVPSNTSFVIERPRSLSRRDGSNQELSLPPATGSRMLEIVCIASGLQKLGLSEEERIRLTLQAILAVNERYRHMKPLSEDDLNNLTDYYNLHNNHRLQ